MSSGKGINLILPDFPSEKKLVERPEREAFETSSGVK
jgi:hypothetical protein